jgi:hypothetical protein
MRRVFLDVTLDLLVGAAVVTDRNAFVEEFVCFVLSMQRKCCLLTSG